MGAISITTLLMLALLLPGIAFVVSAFQASWQDEITPDPPSLTSANGIVVAGGASLAIHMLWTQLLILNANMPPLIGLEPANPYVFLSGELTSLRDPSKIYGLISGLALTTFLGAALGRLIAWLAMRYDKSEYFYGPLAKLLKLAQGEKRFITAYVLSKVQHEGMTLGYEGAVIKLVRDADYTPLSVTLREVTVFQLVQSPQGVKRSTTTTKMPWLMIAAADWHNIAFEVMEFDE